MSSSRIALDSCSILHLLSRNAIWFPHLQPIYNDALNGKILIVVSEVSVAECLRLESVGSSPVTPEESTKRISSFFRHKFIIRRGLTSRESELAGKLASEHGLGTCDALIAATAILAEAGILYSSDGCTGRRKGGKLLTLGEVKTDHGRRMEILSPDKYRPQP